jgi:tRNA U38,U39,U40 pseudouridine synthase TruA
MMHGARDRVDGATSESKPTAATAVAQHFARAAAAVALALRGDGLPTSIRVVRVMPAPGNERFHARESCLGKRYVYTLVEGPGTPALQRTAWVLGHGKVLDVEAMRAASALLEGRHDFSSFGVMEEGDPRAVVRRLRRLSVDRHPLPRDPGQSRDSGGDPFAGDDGSNGSGVGDDGVTDGADGGRYGVVTITGECDKFLYHMMRLLAGTLAMVGMGKLSPQGCGALLAAKSRVAGGDGPVKAPARGLCLDRCFYGPQTEAWD